MDGLNWLISGINSINPLEEPEKLKSIVLRYLKPRGSPAKRAHLFTINGLTYPIHRDFCFAAVPDPHEINLGRQEGKLKFSTQRSKRRYSILAYLHSIRPGDLIFYFQADPQWPKDIRNRRGFRGIWIAASSPFRDATAIKHPVTHYEELGECPHCGTPFNFGQGGLEDDKKCPICGKSYGKVPVRWNNQVKEYSRVVLSARILTQPLIIFKRTAGDNRVYSDMSVEPLIWISRTDNAMGPGKGSSIRVLLPEEAAKIAYMLATEDDQGLEIGNCQAYPGKAGKPIDDYNGKPVRKLRARKVGGNSQFELEHEFHLNLYFSFKIDEEYSPIIRELKIPLASMEYWTSEFPWGYTGDTADFVLSLWDDQKGRHTIYIFEFKKDRIDKRSLAEVLLYVPWVAQVMTQFRHETNEITIYPVLVGRSVRLDSVPDEYKFRLRFFTSPIEKKVTIKSPILLKYIIPASSPIKVKGKDGREIYYVDIDDLDIRSEQRTVKPFTPPPPLTFTTTEVERQYIIDKYLRSF